MCAYCFHFQYCLLLPGMNGQAHIRWAFFPIAFSCSSFSLFRARVSLSFKFFFIYLCCFFTAFALFLSLFFLKISIPSFVGAVLSQFMYSEVSYLRYATTKNDWTFIYTGLSNQTHFNWLLLLMPLILVSLIVAFPSKCSVNSKFQDRSYLL